MRKSVVGIVVTTEPRGFHVYKTNLNRHSLRSVLLLGAASAAAIGMSAPASAQEASLETVVVTGSRIPQQGLYSSSPVTSVGQQEMKLEGTTNVSNLLDSLPGVFTSQNSTSNNGSSGTATLNLRGLGIERTLVLVDGTRLMPGDPTLPAADVNTIPAALVDHVEVLTGGASAVYGSDAISGVVNFIMRKDFEGIEVDGQWSGDQHDNNNGYAQGLFKNAGFTDPLTGAPQSAPSGGILDGESQDATLVLGANTDNGKGNVTAYVGYQHSEPVLEAARDYSACTLDGTTTSLRCGGSANYSLFISIDNAVKGGVGSPTYFGKGAGHKGTGTFVPFTGASSDYFNYGGLNYLQRNDDRYNGGFFAHYQANKELNVYSDVMFTDDRSTSQLAPTALFTTGGLFTGSGANGSPYYQTNCTNPYMTAQENAIVCGQNPGDALIAAGPTEAAIGHPYWNGAGNIVAGQATLLLGRRNIEGGNRTYTFDHQAYRLKVGANGDLGNGWTYDVYAQYGRTVFSESEGGQMSKTNVSNALNVDPITGACVSGAPGCVGLDIFDGFGAITPAMEGYVGVPSLIEGYTQEQILSGSITGDLGAWGIQSPWAKSPVAVSFGSEYRAEALDISPDEENLSGDLEGAGGPTLPEHGTYNVVEGFTEVKVPLVQNVPFFEDLSLNGGYRYSSYNTAGQTSTYKYGAEWQPIDDFRIRASFNRAVRAPNIIELFTPSGLGLFNGQDPCSKGGAPTATVIAHCESAPGSANVPAGSVNTGLLTCPASQCNDFTGGNQALKPEVSETHSLGVVFTPTFFDGFTATVDYFDIQVSDPIGVIPPTYTLNQCYGANATAASQAAFCGFVVRDPTTHLIDFVSATNINTGHLGTKGLDFEANYVADLANWSMPNSGSLSFNFIGTLLNTLTTQSVTGGASYDCAGLYGLTCSGGTSNAPNPRWRHKLRVTWASPWDFDLSVAWRYFGEVGLDSDSKQPALSGAYDAINARLPAYNWFDLAADWNVRQGVDLRAGVNNVFDKDPPLTSIQPLPAGNANTFPGSYDSLGRYIFIGATIKY